MKTGKLEIVSDIKLTGELQDSAGSNASTATEIKDTIEKTQKNEDNIMLNAFRIAVNGSLTQFNMVDGIVDEYEDESGIDTGSSTGEVYNSADDYYGPTPESENTNIKLLLNANGDDSTGGAGATVLDASGNLHPVTNVATAQLSTTQKKFGNASVLLDGDGDYLTIPDHADWIFGTDNFTIDCWVRFSSLSIQVICAQFVDSSHYWAFYLGDPTHIYFVAEQTAGNIGFSGSTSLSADTWYHLAVVRNGTDWRIYQDGTSIGSTTSSQELTDKASVLYIGHNPTASQDFNGYIDEFRISNTARWTENFSVPTAEHSSDANTKLLLHCNTLDVSASHHIPTFYGTAQLDTAEKKFGSASILLDGDSDYISLPDSTDWDIFGSNSDNWTIDLWAKFTDHSGAEYLIAQYEDVNNRWDFSHSDGNGFRWCIKSGGTDIVVLQWGGEITDTNWHHIALIKVADEYGVYVDGTQVLYVQDSDTDILSAPLVIGNNGAAANYFDGHMDDICISHTNVFSAAPNVGLTDTISVPTSERSVTVAAQNLVLISDNFTAESEPDSARIVLLEEDVDSITLNTDIKAYVSRDGGSTWAQATLSDEGNYDSNKKVLAGNADLTASSIGSGTSIKYKIETDNEKDLKLHATGLSWN